MSSSCKFCQNIQNDDVAVIFIDCDKVYIRNYCASLPTSTDAVDDPALSAYMKLSGIYDAWFCLVCRRIFGEKLSS